MSKVAGIILAAGLSSRFGKANKLLEGRAGEAMVVSVAKQVIASSLGKVIVVTGHQPKAIEDALAGLDMSFVHNPDFADGQSTSVKAGVAAVPSDCDGAMILLGDMPDVSTEIIDNLLAAFDGETGIVVPHYKGKRGNPVVIGRAHFVRLQAIKGDKGARELLSGDDVVFVNVDSDAILRDYDTPDDLTDR